MYGVVANPPCRSRSCIPHMVRAAASVYSAFLSCRVFLIHLRSRRHQHYTTNSEPPYIISNNLKKPLVPSASRRKYQLLRSTAMAIFLKRKRSSEDLSDSSRASPSSSDASYGATTIPQTWALTPDHDTCMTGTTHQIDNWSMSFAQVTEITPSHLDSRTRKRFRDSRPDESSIYGAYPLPLLR